MHPNESVLNDYIDGALGVRERTDVEAHLTSCAACRSLVDDLGEITRTAASLDQREPPARAWARIARSIELEGARGVEPDGYAHLKGSRYTRYVAWLAAAAAIMIAAVVGLRYAPSRSTSLPNAPTGSGVEVTSQSIEAELRAAEDHYDKAIKGLEQ